MDLSDRKSPVDVVHSVELGRESFGQAIRDEVDTEAQLLLDDNL